MGRPGVSKPEKGGCFKFKVAATLQEIIDL